VIADTYEVTQAFLDSLRGAANYICRLLRILLLLHGLGCTRLGPVQNNIACAVPWGNHMSPTLSAQASMWHVAVGCYQRLCTGIHHTHLHCSDLVSVSAMSGFFRPGSSMPHGWDCEYSLRRFNMTVSLCVVFICSFCSAHDLLCSTTCV